MSPNASLRPRPAENGNGMAAKAAAPAMLDPLEPACESSEPNSEASNLSLPRPGYQPSPSSLVPRIESWQAAQLIVTWPLYLPLDSSTPCTSPIGNCPDPPLVVAGSSPGRGYGLRKGASLNP
jgi:hypothetical protein